MHDISNEVKQHSCMYVISACMLEMYIKDIQIYDSSDDTSIVPPDTLVDCFCPP